MALHISSEATDDARIVHVTGEVDVSNAPALRAALDEALTAGAARIQVDLSEVPYIDSTGIGVLVGAARRAAESASAIAVVHPQRNVARVLSLLGVVDELGANQ